MGKWCFMSVKVPPEMYDEAKALREMSDETVDAHYESIGKPSPAEFGLGVYWGNSGGGWCQIDNSSHPDKATTPVIFWLRNRRQDEIEMGFKRACILAHRRGVRKLEVKTSV